LGSGLESWDEVANLGTGQKRRAGGCGGVVGLATRGGSSLLHCRSQTVLFPFAAGGLLVLPSHARASSLAVALRWRRTGLVVASSRLVFVSSRLASHRIASHRGGNKKKTRHSFV